MALAERFGWAPRTLLELTATELAFWGQAVSQFDRDQERRRGSG